MRGRSAALHREGIRSERRRRTVEAELRARRRLVLQRAEAVARLVQIVGPELPLAAAALGAFDATFAAVAVRHGDAGLLRILAELVHGLLQLLGCALLRARPAQFRASSTCGA